MAMGRQGPRQGEMLVTWDELPKSPGHVFYDRLQTVLADAGFDAVVEALCRPYYAAAMGAPSLPPGRYFRMHLVGYFEGIDSERGLEWRCADSLSLRDFLGLGLRDRVPDHSWLSRSRARLPLEVHERGFAWLLEQLAERGLVKGGADRNRRLDHGGERGDMALHSPSASSRSVPRACRWAAHSAPQPRLAGRRSAGDYRAPSAPRSSSVPWDLAHRGRRR
jgi:hypothetical protein